MLRKNFDRKVLIGVIVLVFVLAFVIAVHLSANPGVELTINDTPTSTLSPAYNRTFAEDTEWIVNLSINNTHDCGDASSNITEVNVTIPSGFTFTANSNWTTYGGATHGNQNFSSTGAIGEATAGAGVTLIWKNVSTNGAVVYMDDSGNLSTFFVFNITAENPGVYNMTVRWRNGTTVQTENVTFRINDSTIPDNVNFTGQTYTNSSNMSRSGIIVNVSVADNWNRGSNAPTATAFWTDRGFQNGSINITLLYTNKAYLMSIVSNYSNSTLNVNFTNSTGLAEGVYYINVSVNDSANNLNWSALRKVTIDRTAPRATFSCSPTTDVNVGETVTCSCSGNDSVSLADTEVSGVSSVTYNDTGRTSSAEEVTESCIVRDYAGHNTTSSITYTVYASSGSGSSSNGGSGSSSWTTKDFVTDESLQAGHTTQLKRNERARVKVDGMNHYVGVKAVTGVTTVVIQVSSDPQEATLSVGDTRKFEVDGDNVYDLEITLNDIISGKADLTIKAISEDITEESKDEQEEMEKEAAGDEEEPMSLTWLWWTIGIVVVLLVVWKVLKKMNSGEVKGKKK